MKDKWHNWSSSYYLITKRGECVSCVQYKGEAGKRSLQAEWAPHTCRRARSHTHRYSAESSPLMFPCEMSLHDKEEAIRKPLKHYFLSVATVTDLALQLQKFAVTLLELISCRRGLRVGGKTKRQVCLGPQRTLVGWYPVQALLSVQLGLSVTSDPDIWQQLTQVRVYWTGLFERPELQPASRPSAQLVAIQINTLKSGDTSWFCMNRWIHDCLLLLPGLIALLLTLYYILYYPHVSISLKQDFKRLISFMASSNKASFITVILAFRFYELMLRLQWNSLHEGELLYEVFSFIYQGQSALVCIVMMSKSLI